VIAQSITNKQNNILLVEQENQDLGFVGTPKEINQSIIDKIVDRKKSSCNSSDRVR
jgi:acetylglutamate kinase